MTPGDVKSKLRRRWDRGDILSGQIKRESLFPLRFTIRGPSSSELSSNFSAVGDWALSWREQAAIQCEWKNIQHKLFGANELPSAAVFGDVEAAVRLLGVRREWDTFRRISEMTDSAFPDLHPWLARRPMFALDLADDWERLLSVLNWIRDHPRSNLYLRQIDVPGVHTKFVERHRGTLAELLDLILPAELINPDFRGVTGFANRYGLRDKPERIRIRYLDPACAIEPNRLGLDLTLDAAAFRLLDPSVERVFITENEINFLAFPDFPRSIVIFGAGYGWSALAGAEWLQRCAIHYWGDVDTHGFAILDQLRTYLPHTQSLLMDLDTCVAFRDLCTHEATPTKRDLQRLTAGELATLDYLRADARPESPRLEQERLPFSVLEVVLRDINDRDSRVIGNGGLSDATQSASDPA
ncbi:DUF3322 domain-containing protein [Haloferula sp.]|uniref:DUF3322 domain-containing protein n=1 Tax=Haloferula sp. TaxID=2497595 RepID=UPI003C72A34C